MFVCADDFYLYKMCSRLKEENGKIGFARWRRIRKVSKNEFRIMNLVPGNIDHVGHCIHICMTINNSLAVAYDNKLRRCSFVLNGATDTTLVSSIWTTPSASSKRLSLETGDLSSLFHFTKNTESNKINNKIIPEEVKSYTISPARGSSEANTFKTSVKRVLQKCSPEPRGKHCSCKLASSVVLPDANHGHKTLFLLLRNSKNAILCMCMIMLIPNLSNYH